MTDTQQSCSASIREFCADERISISTYYKLKRMGLGPDEMRVPNTTIIRIPPEARVAWREKMKAMHETAVAQVAQQRRSEQAARAGRIAAQSPHHISRKVPRLTRR